MEPSARFFFFVGFLPYDFNRYQIYVPKIVNNENAFYVDGIEPFRDCSRFWKKCSTDFEVIWHFGF